MEGEEEEKKNTLFKNLFLVLALIALLRPPALPLQNRVPVLVDLELRDLHLARVDADGDRLPVYLLSGDALDVDDVFQTVDGNDLALTALERATGNDDLVVLANRD